MKSLITVLLLVICTHYLAQARKSAALVIGGYWYDPASASPTLGSVELFGCKDASGDSIRLNNFPVDHYLSSGVYLSERNEVLVCGGYSCGDVTCNTMNTCYVWDDTVDQWSPAPPLNANRFNYLMAQTVNLNKPEQGKVPLALAYGLTTEIWDTSINAWVPHLDINDRNWYSLNCLIEYGDKIYSLRDSVVEVDPATWSITELDSIPTPLVRSGRCAGTAIGGRPGIMTAYGFWYDLEDKTWHKKATPPMEPVAGYANSMWSFRGQATIFGHPACNDTGFCNNTGVYQYKSEKDSWVNIGSMLSPRTYQTIIEVPGKICDSFVAASKVDTDDEDETFGDNYRKAAANTVFRRGLHG